MEKSKDMRENKEYSDPESFDSPEKVAKLMREADYAFDFRGCTQWSHSGGMRVVSDGVISTKRD